MVVTLGRMAACASGPDHRWVRAGPTGAADCIVVRTVLLYIEQFELIRIVLGAVLVFLWQSFLFGH